MQSAHAIGWHMPLIESFAVGGDIYSWCIVQRTLFFVGQVAFAGAVHHAGAVRSQFTYHGPCALGPSSPGHCMWLIWPIFKRDGMRNWDHLAVLAAS
jgi:hypothetical protein